MCCCDHCLALAAAAGAESQQTRRERPLREVNAPSLAGAMLAAAAGILHAALARMRR